MRGLRRGLIAAVFLVASCAAPPSPTPDPVSPVPSVAAWQPGPEAPVALIEQATAVHDGRIWIAGGLTADGRAFDGVRVLDPRRGTWTDGPSLPRPVHHAVLVSDGTDLWLLGGYVGGGFDAPTDAVWALPGGDLDDDWEPRPALPEPRAAGAAAWNGSRLLYGGGVRPGVISDLVLALDQGAEAWLPITRLSRPREHLAAATDGLGRTFFVGGRQGVLTSNLSRVDVVTGDTSEVVGEMPSSRGGVAAFWWPSLGACMLGGEAPDRVYRDVECITPDGETSVLPQMLVPRHGFGAVVVDGTAYAVLGGPEPGLTVSSSTETLALP